MKMTQARQKRILVVKTNVREEFYCCKTIQNLQENISMMNLNLNRNKDLLLRIT